MSAHIPPMPPETVAASFDYITAYWSPEDSGRFPHDAMRQILTRKEAEGYDEAIRTQRGVHWIGRGGSAMGIRGDERWLRASGPDAHTVAGQSLATSTHVSRCDLAVTCRWPSPWPQVATGLYEHFSGLRPAAGQPRTAQLIQNSADGDTCYIGSRHSDTFLRVYDWGAAHQTDPAGCSWRYEVELKGDRAERHGRPLLLAEDRESRLSAYVNTTFKDRRIPVPWQAGVLRGEIQPCIKKPLEKRLDWLQTQIRPSVLRLVEAGYIESVIEALGLSDHVSFLPPK